METIKTISQILALPLVLLVIIYQKTLSPDHGLLKAHFPHGYCKFYPSCSMFAKEVLLHDGILGLPRIVKRVISCNPFSFGGVDLPYKK